MPVNQLPQRRRIAGADGGDHAMVLLCASDYAVAKQVQGFKVWPADAPRYWNVRVTK